LTPAEIARVNTVFISLAAEAAEEERAWVEQARVVFAVVYGLGLRRGKVPGHRWRHVRLADAEGPTLRVEETFVCNRVETPKSTASTRTIALGRVVAEEPFEHRSSYDADEDRVFCHLATGGPLHHERYAETLDAALAHAGIEDEVSVRGSLAAERPGVHRTRKSLASLREDHPRIAWVICHDEVPQERVAHEAVVDDVLEHHVRIRLTDGRRMGRMDGAAKPGEVPLEDLPGLVLPFQCSHRWIIKAYSNVSSELLIEDQRVASRVDSTSIDSPPGTVRGRNATTDCRSRSSRTSTASPSAALAASDAALSSTTSPRG
jgi:hypothetical protein